MCEKEKLNRIFRGGRVWVALPINHPFAGIRANNIPHPFYPDNSISCSASSIGLSNNKAYDILWDMTTTAFTTTREANDNTSKGIDWWIGFDMTTDQPTSNTDKLKPFDIKPIYALLEQKTKDFVDKMVIDLPSQYKMKGYIKDI